MELSRQFYSVVPLFDSCHAALMRFFETVVVFAIAEAAVVCIITIQVLLYTGCQRHGLAVLRAGDRFYVTGLIHGWNRSYLTYVTGGC